MLYGRNSSGHFTAFVRIKPAVDKSSFRSETDKAIKGAGLGKSGTDAGKAFGSGFVRAAGAGLALLGGVALFKSLLAGAREGADQMRLTAAVIKSTGGAANVSAGQVQNLANSLMQQAGVSRTVVTAGENMLLTFRGVRNEAGKGNDIFSQASQAILDMTAAMHGGEVSQEGMRKTAIQVGKALQDPIKGAGALRRVGVMLTDQQQKQIAAFVKSGDVMAAQKIILGELKSEFGGAAAAMADPIQRLMVTLRMWGVTVVKQLLPPLEKFVDFAQKTVVPVIGKVAGTIRAEAGAAFASLFTGKIPQPKLPKGKMTGYEPPDVPGWQKFLVVLHDAAAGIMRVFGPVVIRFLHQFVAAAGQVWQGVRNLWAALQPVAVLLAKLVGAAVIGAFRTLGDLLAKVIGPAFVKVTGFIKTNQTWFQALAVAIVAVVAGMKLWALWQAVITKATKLWAAAQALLNVVMSANPIGIVVLALAALAAGFYYAWTRSATFRKVVEGAWNAVKGTALAVVGWFTRSFVPFFTVTIPAVFNTVLTWVKRNWPWLLGALTGPIGLAVVAIVKNWKAISDGVVNTFNGIVGFMKTIPGRITGALGNAWTVLVNWGKNVINGLWRGMNAVISGIWDFIKSIPKRILGFLGIHSPPQWAIDAGRQILNGIGIGMTQARHAVTKATAGTMAGIGGGVTGWLTAAMKSAGVPASWLGPLIQLVVRESGGNPGAVNPIAVMGEHASGLLQMLPSTYRQFATLAGGIFNPIANAAAAIRYIMARYGAPWNIPNLYGPGYAGFAGGGLITEPILGIGRSGRMYGFGESGPETVTPGRGGGNTYVIHQHIAPGVSKAEVGAGLIDAIRAYEQANGKRWRT